MKVPADLEFELRDILHRWNVRMDNDASATASVGQRFHVTRYSVFGPHGRVGPPGTHAEAQRLREDLTVQAVADLIATRAAQCELLVAGMGPSGKDLP